RWVYVSSFVLGVGLIIALRLILDRFEADPRRQRQVLLLGVGATAKIIADLIESSPRRYALVGCVKAASETSVRDWHLPMAGSTSDLEGILKVRHPDVIVVASEARDAVLPLDVILAHKVQGTEVEDWPTFYEKAMGKIHIANLRPSWLVFSDGFR